MNLRGKKAAIVTLGCKVNQYETDAMWGMLLEAGAVRVAPKEAADIYIVNTCSVTNMAERKSRQMLHRAKKKNPDVVVIAVGCYAQVGKDELLKDENIDLIIGNNKKKDLVRILEEFFPDEKPELEVLDIGKDKEYETLRIKNLNEHTRAYIKVQDGCNQFCSYCIIPYARGRVRSRKQEDILDEIRNLCQKGCQEFVITGIHVTSYGVDLGNITLIDLLEAIARIDGVKRIRLGSLEPGFITEDVIKRLDKIESFCPHFHLSLQSGCDATLKRMNRKYTTEEIREKCSLIRKYFEFPALTTDIIVGFPGETENEFEQTREFLEEIHLYEMHVFKYSIRKGTKAAEMEHQVEDQVKTKRSNILLEMSKRHQKEFEEKQLGMIREILIEEAVDGKENIYTGHTREYIKTEVYSEKPLENRIIQAKLTAVSENGFVEATINPTEKIC